VKLSRWVMGPSEMFGRRISPIPSRRCRIDIPLDQNLHEAFSAYGPRSTATDVVGSAFAARKHDSVRSSTDENGENPASEDFDTLESTESDGGLEFSNSFDALRGRAAVAAPPEKKVRRNMGVYLPPPSALSTCDTKRMHYLEEERAIKVTLLPDEVGLQGGRVDGRLLRCQGHLYCACFKGVSQSLEPDL
jgi:hypothetical protein